MPSRFKEGGPCSSVASCGELYKSRKSSQIALFLKAFQACVSFFLGLPTGLIVKYPKWPLGQRGVLLSKTTDSLQ